MTTSNARLNLEYYIIDDWIKYHPGQGDKIVGTVETDGGVYDIHIGNRWAQGMEPSWRRIFSVRREKRTAGTITAEKHFAAWKALGQTFERHMYSVLAVEGYQSTGEADVAVLDYQSA